MGRARSFSCLPLTKRISHSNLRSSERGRQWPVPCIRWDPMRQQRPRLGRTGTALAGNRNTMAIRDFTDSAGIAWRVWSTTPQTAGVYDESHKTGWLTFESAGIRRRLAPIPRGWEEATRERLDLMCRAAEVVRRASGSAPLTPDPEAPDAADRPQGRGRPDAPDSQ